MILLDPDLDPDPAPRGKAVAPSSVRRRTPLPKLERLPTPRTMSRFLADAQAAVRLRGAVTVLLTTDKAIRRLNRDFRGIDKATDVLSFPAERIPGPKSAEQSAEQAAGDLAISVDTARKQAAEQGHRLSIELKVLALHGLLHLAGYDHEIDDGRMARSERKLRAELGLPLGLIERANQGRTNQSDVTQGRPSQAASRPTRSRNR